MISEKQKRKIQEFLTATDWPVPDWEDQEALAELSDILKAFNNDSQLAIQYWQKADQQSNEAIRAYYLDNAYKMGFCTKKPISKKVVLDHFAGDELAVEKFFEQQRKNAQAISIRVFHENFTDVVMQMLVSRNTVQ